MLLLGFLKVELAMLLESIVIGIVEGATMSRCCFWLPSSTTFDDKFLRKDFEWRPWDPRDDFIECTGVSTSKSAVVRV